MKPTRIEDGLDRAARGFFKLGAGITLLAIVGVLVALMVACSAPAKAHIPAECAAHVQQLEWALEGQDETSEHVTLALEHADGAIRAGLVEQYARVSGNVRSKALLLIGCIMDPPSASLPVE